MIIFDQRWVGHFGIGRFQREMRERIEINPVRMLDSESSPASLRGTASLWGDLMKNPQASFYSAGFAGTFGGAGKQLLTVWDLTHLEQSNRSMAKTLYYNSVVKPAIKKAGVVMTGTTASRDSLSAWLRNDQISIEVVGCGVSSPFKVDPLIPRQRNLVLMVSTLLPHKNALTGLQAMAKLDPEIRMIWVTNDKLAADQLVESMSLQARVDVRTQVADESLASLYQQSSCLLFPSLNEGFGLPPIEALACGLPVVASRTCDAVMANVGNEPGVTAVESATDALEWAESVYAVMDSSQVIDTDLSRFAWSSVANRVSQVLEENSDSSCIVRAAGNG